MEGLFFKTMYKGSMAYGMVARTNVQYFGKKVCDFVYAEDGAHPHWTSFLVDKKELLPVEGDELKKAYESARLYWRRTYESLKFRRAQNFEIDDPAVLDDMIATAKEWVDKLG